eukprot:6278075-Karenia_brevis.AAC.1
MTGNFSVFNVFDGRRLIARKFSVAVVQSDIKFWPFKKDGIEIISYDRGNHTTPSCSTFADSELLIGDTTQNQVARNLANTVFDA